MKKLNSYIDLMDEYSGGRRATLIAGAIKELIIMYRVETESIGTSEKHTQEELQELINL